MTGSPPLLRVLDLFSGIGGFSLGLERTGGFRTVAFCEADPFCRRVLARHWPGVTCLPDVERAEFVEGGADVVTAGFPCQDLSYAGDGAGLSGARSGLYRHVVRAIRLVRPWRAVLENVAALLGRGLGTVLGDLAEIGYDAEWHCIPASAVGAPHRRDRVWIVADRDRDGQPRGTQPDVRAEAGLEAPFGRNIERLRASLADAGASRLAAPELQALLRAGRRDEGRAASECGWWSVEPDVGRVAHGVPARVDRLRTLGNAVVPEIPELIGHALLAGIGGDGRSCAPKPRDEISP